MTLAAINMDIFQHIFVSKGKSNHSELNHSPVKFVLFSLARFCPHIVSNPPCCQHYTCTDMCSVILMR